VFCGLCICLFVTAVSCAKTAEPIEMPFLIYDLRAVGTMYNMGFRIPIMYSEYLAFGQHSQPYSVGCSSDVAFHCQYCSNLFRVAVAGPVMEMCTNIYTCRFMSFRLFLDEFSE